MKLVIISGQPATGKTTIGQKISETLGYEFVSKDTIKEELYASEARTTHDYLWYENKAKKLLFEEARDALRKGKPVVIESNFTARDRPELHALINNKTQAVELYCFAKGFTILRRYSKRNESGERHLGHHDRRWYPIMVIFATLNAMGIRWPYSRVGLGKETLSVDTTDFSKVDYDKVTHFIENA